MAIPAALASAYRKEDVGRVNLDARRPSGFNAQAPGVEITSLQGFIPLYDDWHDHALDETQPHLPKTTQQ